MRDVRQAAAMRDVKRNAFNAAALQRSVIVKLLMERDTARAERDIARAELLRQRTGEDNGQIPDL